MPINNFKVYMPTDEPIIIYMKFIYIGDKIIRNETIKNKEFAVRKIMADFRVV